MACQPYECAYAEDGKPTDKASVSLTAQTKEDSTNTTQKPYSDPPQRYAAIKRPEWWLVLAAFLTFGVVGWQAWETRRSVRAATISAFAAKLNSDALISSERAWILAELKMNSFLHGTAGDGKESTDVHFDLICRNAGSTPAWIYEQAVRVKVMDKVIASKEEHPPPDMLEVGGIGQRFYQIHSLTNDMELYCSPLKLDTCQV